MRFINKVIHITLFLSTFISCSDSYKNSLGEEIMILACYHRLGVKTEPFTEILISRYNLKYSGNLFESTEIQEYTGGKIANEATVKWIISYSNKELSSIEIYFKNTSWEKSLINYLDKIAWRIGNAKNYTWATLDKNRKGIQAYQFYVFPNNSEGTKHLLIYRPEGSW